MPRRYCYDYPRPALTVDLAIFARGEAGFRVLMIRRKKPPYEGCWAFPGGFVEIDERIEDAARRELVEETGLDLSEPLDFLGVWDEPSRDPRGRVISMVYAAALPGIPATVEGRDDAEEAAWLDPLAFESLAFDHDDILSAAWQWLVKTMTTEPIALRFLGTEFTRADLNHLFRSLHVEARHRKPAIERILAEHAELIPGRDLLYRPRARRGRARGKGPPRKGSRNPSRGV